MADALLSATVQVALETAINLASVHISSIPGIKNDFEKLKDTLTVILDVLRDAEERQVTEEATRLWLEELERVAFDAENFLDDFNFEVNRRRIEIQNQTKRKVPLTGVDLNPLGTPVPQCLAKIKDFYVQ
nr:putative disease resistance protein RGA3 [Coffea arabica]